MSIPRSLPRPIFYEKQTEPENNFPVLFVFIFVFDVWSVALWFTIRFVLSNPDPERFPEPARLYSIPEHKRFYLRLQLRYIF